MGSSLRASSPQPPHTLYPLPSAASLTSPPHECTAVHHPWLCLWRACPTAGGAGAQINSAREALQHAAMHEQKGLPASASTILTIGTGA
eukprot:COSAG01_NODE_7745_length_3075_cov_1.975806_3_plen_89_part_00